MLQLSATLLEMSVLESGAYQIPEGLPQILRFIGQDCPLKGNLYVISSTALHSKCIYFPQDYEKRAQNMVSMLETRSIVLFFNLNHLWYSVHIKQQR